MEDIWWEALHQYLQSSEWYETINVFVESHCAIFERTPSDQPNEYFHGHYTIFKQFVEISEQILNDMLANLGGSMDQLTASLNSHSYTRPTGPRDDMQKEIILQLLSFDSFPEVSERALMKTSIRASERSESSSKRSEQQAKRASRN